MDEQKVMDVLDLCDQLDKIRSLDHHLRRHQRIFHELGIKPFRHISDLDDEDWDEIKEKLEAEIQKEKDRVLESKEPKISEF